VFWPLLLQVAQSASVSFTELFPFLMLLDVTSWKTLYLILDTLHSFVSYHGLYILVQVLFENYMMYVWGSYCCLPPASGKRFSVCRLTLEITLFRICRISLQMIPLVMETQYLFH
jgi:hypothetical protein